MATLAIGGTPLVARALGDEPVVESASDASDSNTGRRFGEWPVQPSTSIPGLGVDLDPIVVTPVLPKEPVDPPIDAEPAAPVLPLGTVEVEWSALRQCEAGGNYAITNPSGKYRGAYQFDRSTWNSVAERHAPELVGADPAAASPTEQDAMAYALYSERGARPWPHCGRHLP